MHRIEQEQNRRMEIWQTLLSFGGPRCVSGDVIRSLRIQLGRAGIWRDLQHTRVLSDSGIGVTVGLVLNGKSYADGVSDETVAYRYPNTVRKGNFDCNEIEATKSARRLGLPVFVVAPASIASHKDVQLGWIDTWDDQTRQFWVRVSVTP